MQTLNVAEQSNTELKKKLTNEEHTRKSADSALEGAQSDAQHNLLFNYCNLLFLVFLCKKRYFRFR